MSNTKEWWFRVRDFYRFHKREQKDLLLTTLIVTFIFAYNDKAEAFILANWLMNFVLTGCFVGLALFVHTSAQKIFGLQQGFTTEFRAWPIGLVISLILTLITGGNFYVLLIGGMVIRHVTLLRLGKWRYGENESARGLIASTGPVANLVLATIALALSKQLNFMPEVFGWMATINLWIMVYSLLPLPRMDGIHLFVQSRLVYVFIGSTLLSYTVFAAFGIFSWILAFIIGVICWLLFFIYVEGV